MKNSGDRLRNKTRTRRGPTALAHQQRQLFLAVSHELADSWIVILAILLMVLTSVACNASGEKRVLTPDLTGASLVPPPLSRSPTNVSIDLETVEKQIEIAPGVQYPAWTFNGTVPGPFIRVRQGDTVQVNLKNSPNSSHTHSIDLHAVTGPGGGAAVTSVAPGEEKSFQFKATKAGLFVYHCASGVVADHIANGMYGLILVESPGRLPPVSREFYVMQGEFYATGETAAQGLQQQDLVKLLAEQPAYVMFNGHTQSLIGDRALKASVGETVRIYFGNGGPNLASSFHIIGEIFDKVYNEASIVSPPVRDVQTTLVPAGGATIVDLHLDVPGDYKLVDHSLGRLLKGALGTLHVEGSPHPELFKALGPPSTAAPSDHGAPAAATASPSAEATTIDVSMRDNFFVPTEITVKAGQPVTLTLLNDGAAPHNMRIAGIDGKYNSADDTVSEAGLILGGQQGVLHWQAPEPGRYPFQCDIHPPGMSGTIIVE